MHTLNALLLLATLTLTAPHASAQSLVELCLRGEVDVTGGAHFEAEVAFADGAGGAAKVELALHLAERTSAFDLATLLAQRLERGGARVLLTAEKGPARGSSVLFVENCLGVALRLGRGLNASVTLCEEGPASVRLLPPQSVRSGAEMLVNASTFHPHLKQRGRLEITHALPPQADANEAGAAMVNKAIAAGWLGELIDHRSWRPLRLADGSQLTGVSLELRGGGDWRLELEIEPRLRPR